MGIHLNACFGVRDEIGERKETEFHNCLAFCSAFEGIQTSDIGWCETILITI
jgi:hypothetical protein